MVRPSYTINAPDCTTCARAVDCVPRHELGRLVLRWRERDPDGGARIALTYCRRCDPLPDGLEDEA